MSWRDTSKPMDERVRLYIEEQDRKRREDMDHARRAEVARMIQEARKRPYPRLGDEGTISKGPRLRLMLVQEPPSRRRRS